VQICRHESCSRAAGGWSDAAMSLVVVELSRMRPESTWISLFCDLSDFSACIRIGYSCQLNHQ